jgi:polysaccharide biosynthesis transport protein
MNPPSEERMSDDSTTIDVGAWLTTLIRNWWIVVGLLVLGAVVAGVVTLASPKQYTATSSVYIGQTTDANGSAIAGLNSGSRAATELLSSEVVLRAAAKEVGMGATASRLRRETTLAATASTVKTATSAVNIIVISVTDPNKRRAAAAANALANVVLQRISPNVDAKIALLQQELDQGNQLMKASVTRSDAAQNSLAAIARHGGATAQKASAAALYVAIVQAAAAEQEALVASNQKIQLLIFSAKTVERPSILHEAAVPDAPSGPDLKLNVAVGALAGLVIGVIAAFARKRLSERAAPAPATSA